MIAVFSALKEEISELKKKMSVSRISTFQECRIFEGRCADRESLLVLTGVGKELALQAAKQVIKNYRVSALISTGFGGALNEKTKVGDIVICSKLACGPGSSKEKSPKNVLESDSGLISESIRALEGLGLGFLIGSGITIPEVSITPEGKTTLGKKYNADVVDMESYWIGQIAAEEQLPFIEVRSIFDSELDDLSPLAEIISNGKINLAAALSTIIAHPERIKS